MPKFRPARRGGQRAPAPSVAGGLPCIILVIAAFVLVMLFMYFVMKYSTQ